MDTMDPDDLIQVKHRVFVDASVLVGSVRSTKTLDLAKLHLLAQAASIELVTTTLTRQEFARKAAERVLKRIDVIERDDARRWISEVAGVELPSFADGELYEHLFFGFRRIIIDATSGDRWVCLDSAEIDLNAVFDQYGRRTGLFDLRVKKSQYADAIIFEQLKAIACDTVPLIIFAFDDDFTHATDDSRFIRLTKSWEGLLDALGVGEDVPEVRGLLQAQEQLVIDVFIDKYAAQIEALARSTAFPLDEPGKPVILNVDVDQGPALRAEDEVLVAGVFTVHAEIRGHLPPDFLRLFGVSVELSAYPARPLRISSRIDVTAILYLGDRGGYAGELELMADFGGFAIRPLYWQPLNA